MMLIYRLPLFHTARKLSRGGFTLVELLVVIGIIAILAGVALGPITSGIKKAKQSSAMQTARTLAVADFQYSNDNGTYADGADAGVIAAALIAGKYISDPKMFAITGSKNFTVYPGTGTIAQANVSYDFAGVGGTYTGVTSSASDLLPLLWSDGEPTAKIPTTVGVGTAVTLAGGGAFATDGMAVAYKSNSAKFVTPQPGVAPAFPGVGKVGFVDQSFDPTGTTFVIRTGAGG